MKTHIISLDILGRNDDTAFADLGFVREDVTEIFGAGAAYDGSLIAFKLPNFMRSLVAEGAFVQSFVPLLSEYQTRNKPDELRLFIE